ncbi:MAG: hypothetical protein WKF67_14330, partial [Rubrobacteraceae bacterium]
MALRRLASAGRPEIGYGFPKVGFVEDDAFERDASGAQPVGEAGGEGNVQADFTQLLDVPEDSAGVPSRILRPPSITTTRSKSAASDIEW